RLAEGSTENLRGLESRRTPKIGVAGALQEPDELSGVLLCFLIGVRHIPHAHVSELLRRRGPNPVLPPAFTVRVGQHFRAVPWRQKARERIATLRCPDRVLRTGAGPPDRWMGLLIGTGPWVHVAVVPVAALPAKGLRGGPGLHNQVVRLLHSLATRSRK